MSYPGVRAFEAPQSRGGLPRSEIGGRGGRKERSRSVRGEKSEMQTSESFRLSAVLSFSGGLQDAYTYNVRGNVFANAQTGNVVLMSQNIRM